MWKVSKMLGHRDITTTFRIYSHLTPEGREDVAERMEQVSRARSVPRSYSTKKPYEVAPRR
jgi:site-specific recombinase XerD